MFHPSAGSTATATNQPNTTTMTYQEESQSVLNLFKKFESENCHAENYLLLANYMRDDEAIAIARLNIQFQKEQGYTNTDLRNLAHKYCNPFHAILIDNCNLQEYEKNDSLENHIDDWSILAEHSGEQYYLELESPCGNYGSSLIYCEDCGANPVVQCYDEDIAPASMKRVPAEVMAFSIAWEAELNADI